MTQYRLVATPGYSTVLWSVQKRVSFFGIHLCWWTLFNAYSKAEGEEAFKAFTTPGKYGERL